MPSINDVFNQLVTVNGTLTQINNNTVTLIQSTNAVKTSVDQVDTALNAGFANLSQRLQILITQEIYTNQALFHLSQQNDTIICVLEHISKNTCELLNEAHIQTGLQTSMQKNSAALLD